MAVPTQLIEKTTVHSPENQILLCLLLLGASLAYTHPVRLHRCHGAAWGFWEKPRTELEVDPGVALWGSTDAGVR